MPNSLKHQPCFRYLSDEEREILEMLESEKNFAEIIFDVSKLDLAKLIRSSNIEGNRSRYFAKLKKNYDNGNVANYCTEQDLDMLFTYKGLTTDAIHEYFGDFLDDFESIIRDICNTNKTMYNTVSSICKFRKLYGPLTSKEKEIGRTAKYT